VRWSSGEIIVARRGDEAPRSTWQTDEWLLQLNEGWRYVERGGSIHVQRPPAP
jgi:hypothetical protein